MFHTLILEGSEREGRPTYVAFSAQGKTGRKCASSLLPRMVVGAGGWGPVLEIGWGIAAEAVRGLAANWWVRPSAAPTCRCECPDCKLVGPEEVISRALLVVCVALAVVAGATGGLLCGILCCGRRQPAAPRRIADDRATLFNGRARTGYPLAGTLQ